MSRSVRTSKWILLFAVVALFAGAWNFFERWNQADLFATFPVYQRGDTWILAGQCARDTGVLLAGCSDKKNLVPFEDLSTADDPGHALILGILGKYSRAPIDKVTLVKINFAINALGTLLIAGLLWYGDRKIAACLFMLWAAGVVFLNFLCSDVTGAFWGIFGLALALPLWLAIHSAKQSSNLVLWTGIAVGTLLIGIATVLREPIGLIGSLSALLALVPMMRGRWASCKPATKLLYGACVLIMTVLPSEATSGLVWMRKAAFGVEPGKLMHRHGFSHNLYLGLGAKDNPWGIVWDDGNAESAVKRANPKVAYVSEEYYSILWRLYLDKVAHYPITVISIYVLKTIDILQMTMPRQPTIGISVLLLLLIPCLRLIPRFSKFFSFADEALPMIGILAFAGLLILGQGVLTIPYYNYIFPVAIVIALIAGLFLDRLSVSLMMPASDVPENRPRWKAGKQKQKSSSIASRGSR